MARIKRGLKALVCLGLLLIVSGCAGNPFGDASVLPLNEAKHTGKVVAINSHNPVKLFVDTFIDERTEGNERKIGTLEKGVVVYGINGPQIFTDGTVSQLVSDAMRRQFLAGGYDLVAASEADFELTGMIRKYQITIGARDKIAMMVAVNLYTVTLLSR